MVLYNTIFITSWRMVQTKLRWTVFKNVLWCLISVFLFLKMRFPVFSWRTCLSYKVQRKCHFSQQALPTHHWPTDPSLCCTSPLMVPAYALVIDIYWQIFYSFVNSVEARISVLYIILFLYNWPQTHLIHKWMDYYCFNN